MSADEAAAWLAQSTTRLRTSAVSPGAPAVAGASVVDEGWVESRPRRYLSELVAPPIANSTDAADVGEATAAAGRKRAGRRGPVVHVVARCDRLLKVEMYWQCAGCGQRLPGAPPGEDAAECTGGACGRPARKWVADGCMTVDDGTAECRLWSEGDTLIKGIVSPPLKRAANRGEPHISAPLAICGIC